MMRDVRLTVGTFGGASAFPTLVADRIGACAARGIAVTMWRTPDADALRTGLDEGRLDLVHATPDNVVAWRDGRAGGPGSRVAAVLAGGNGPISLVGRGMGAGMDLRGRRIGVDAPQSGFAPILRRVLAGWGLGETEVELIPLGATRIRFESLIAGGIDASMLTLPWSRLAEEAGCTVLTDHRSVAPDLLTSCTIARIDPMGPGEAAIAAYGDALEDALAWVAEPRNTTPATDWLAQDLMIDRASASSVLATMRDPVTGWPAPHSLDRSSLAATLVLRAEIGVPAREAPGAYVQPNGRPLPAGDG